MITLQQLTEKITTDLNNNSLGLIFDIYVDGEKYEKPTRSGNAVTEKIQGVSSVIDSGLIIANGIKIMSMVVGVNLALRIKTGYKQVPQLDGSVKKEPYTYEDTLLPVRQVLSEYFSTAHSDSFAEDSKSYVVTWYGTQPTADTIDTRANIGQSGVYSFTVRFGIVENGWNTQDIEIKFENEVVPFTQMTLSRTPLNQSGVFSNSNGSVKNYSNGSALELSLSVPALKGSLLSEYFNMYLLNGNNSTYDVIIDLDKTDTTHSFRKAYTMRFGQSNITGNSNDNIGQSIILIEGLYGV